MKLTPFFAILFLMANICSQSLWSQINEPEISRGYFIGGVVWSPDSHWLAVATNKGVWLHETDNLEKMPQIISLGYINSVDWHPINNFIAIGKSDGGVFVVDAVSREIQILFSPTERRDDTVTSVRWSPDGQHLAILQPHIFQMIILDFATYQPIQTIELRRDVTLSQTLAWSPDSTFIATHNGGIAIWQLGKNDPIYLLER